MSRYLRTALEGLTLDEIGSALAALGLPHERAASGEQIQLEGSLECVGEPVDLRVPIGVYGSVEDFGFLAQDPGAPELVCGEFDAKTLNETLIPAIMERVLELRLRAEAKRSGKRVELRVDAEGRRTLLLRRG